MVITKLEIREFKELLGKWNTVTKKREFCKNFWKIKILDFKKVQYTYITPTQFLKTTNLIIKSASNIAVIDSNLHCYIVKLISQQNILRFLNTENKKYFKILLKIKENYKILSRNQ